MSRARGTDSTDSGVGLESVRGTDSDLRRFRTESVSVPCQGLVKVERLESVR